MMKFTDLNIDCLEIVLEYLSLVDLLNVADSTKRLRRAAELVYARKQGNKFVFFTVLKMSRGRENFEGFCSEDIFIRYLKTALQLLRCFGRQISTISFFGRIVVDPEIYQKLVPYINNYCAQNLNVVSMKDESYLLKYFDRPFSNLTEFKTWGNNFPENVCLNRLFPNMKQLTCCYHEDGSFYDSNTKYFPHLEVLTIFEGGRGEYIHEGIKEMFINFLQLNPQLKELSILQSDYNYILDINVIRKAVDNLQNIETLKLELKPSTTFIDNENIIQMKNVKTLTIYNQDISWFDSELCGLPFLFEKLETFSIVFPQHTNRFPTNSAFFYEFYNFISRHPSMVTLSIQNNYRNSVDWLRLAKYLPLLVEITIAGGCDVDEIIEIVDNFRMLRKFSFHLYLTEVVQYDILWKQLGSKWIEQKKIIRSHEFIRLYTVDVTLTRRF